MIPSSLKLWAKTGINPATFKWSSVNVPVLSKTHILTFPAGVILFLLIQIIWFFLNLPWAIPIAIPKQQGRVGGTAVVIKSKPCLIIFIYSSYSSSLSFALFILTGNTDKKPITQRDAIKKINLKLSFSNFESPFTGYKIDLIKFPLTLLKPEE